MSNTGLYTDKELFALIAEGNHDAYKTLLFRHRNNVFSHAMAYLKDVDNAQDITQDVFLSIWNVRASLATIENPENYLFILARNRIISAFREKVKLSVLDDAAAHQSDEAQLPDRQLENKQLSSLIQLAVDQMPRQRRKVFELSKKEGLKYDEIAQRLGISRNTVRIHMVQALASIRAFMRSRVTILLLFYLFL